MCWAIAVGLGGLDISAEYVWVSTTSEAWTCVHEQVMDGLNEVLNAWLTEDEYILATEQHRAYRAGEGVWARKGSAVLARTCQPMAGGCSAAQVLQSCRRWR